MGRQRDANRKQSNPAGEVIGSAKRPRRQYKARGTVERPQGCIGDDREDSAGTRTTHSSGLLPANSGARRAAARRRRQILMDPCFVCRQSHFEHGVLVPARPNPEQPCEHREGSAPFRLPNERLVMGRLPAPVEPPCLRRAHRRHLPGHERLERMLARRAAYLRETGRTEAA